ncbi:bifunctional diaminohydroxyphosphoribosylaminopyrimidine deaminase/5-amino-6-(5-phosphoribosylamino)uracil reductase RibD [Palleronia sp. KMU-117]|uniref:bifunctional diaminohydroxyphosphoribosylaminopyrimidine deaminase/5-amino-6-(5-phosphoribosylamino)uracil reductase RibD n=1 Tax=Palleronia sp. KMU-117 TaxID=3434108 RepID=UPI003D759A4D
MALALALGRRGQGTTWPNPSVGCVIVRDGRIVGRGWTRPGGRPHAESVALDQAGAAARGATAYVSLEPCAHHGKTPPCAEALVTAGIARVVTAMTDPDPRVSGAGHRILEAAGVAVTTAVREDEARRDHAGFVLSRTQGRPFLTLKLALTLDGRIATASGESRWITGPGARRRVHAMRACHDAVLIGGGTARADDPALTVRGLGPLPQPVRIVASAGLDLPTDSRLLRGLGEAPLWVVVDDDRVSASTGSVWTDQGVRLLPVAAGPDGRLAPRAMMAALAEAGLTRVLCEGGGALAASLLGADLVDELVVFSAGLAIGAEGRPGLGDLGLGRLADARRFRLRSTEAVDGDVLHRWSRD